jgi:hypothetical protein
VILKTFWVWHKAEDGPDCELGWTQDGVDANPEGWERMKEERLLAYGDSIHSTREIELRVDYDAILKHWWPDPTDAEVVA